MTGTRQIDRIYFDENSGDELGLYDLGIACSRSDLERLGTRLSDGLRVLLYDGDEVEVEATIHYDGASNRRLADPHWDTARRSGDEERVRGAAD